MCPDLYTAQACVPPGSKGRGTSQGEADVPPPRWHMGNDAKGSLCRANCCRRADMVTMARVVHAHAQDTTLHRSSQHA